jgi:hypothetical protein
MDLVHVDPSINTRLNFVFRASPTLLNMCDLALKIVVKSPTMLNMCELALEIVVKSSEFAKNPKILRTTYPYFLLMCQYLQCQTWQGLS